LRPASCLADPSWFLHFPAHLLHSRFWKSTCC
jgi:hypothetical protein